MYRISKQFDFSAGHQLNHVPEGHPCGFSHGHNYKVWVVLESNNLENQWIMDFRALEPLKKLIDTTFDHKFITAKMLRDIIPISDPYRKEVTETTSENMSYAFYSWAKSLKWPISSVKVAETDKTWAEYSIIPDVIDHSYMIDKLSRK